MKSTDVVFPEAGKVVVRERDVPSPGENEIRCVADKSLISIGTELYCLKGEFDRDTNWAEWVQYPFGPGYSMAARVEAVGPGVTGIKEGDRVAAVMSHNQVFNVDYHNVHLIPNGVSSEEASWMLLAVTTQLAVRRAQLALGESVGVIGLGMLGQLVTQYLRVSGARRIVVMDPVQSRLALARENGATHTLGKTAADSMDDINVITEGKKLDVIFDITGHPAVLRQATPLVRKLGRVVLLGDTPIPSTQTLGPNVVSDSVAILGIHGTMSAPFESPYNQWTRSEITNLFFDYLIQKRMNVKNLITHRESPSAAPEVYDRLVKDRTSAVGVIFDWDTVRPA